MANDLNRVILIGRLVRDHEVRYTQSGTAACNFSIVSNYSYAQSGEKKEQASFFNCIAWAKLGETINQYCKKGHRVGVEGRLRQRSWEDQNGNKRSTVEIVVNEVQFLTPKSSGKVDEAAGKVEEAFSEVPDPFSDNDIPF